MPTDWQVDTKLSRCIALCTLIGMILGAAFYVGGWISTAYKATSSWRELKDLKDDRHDEEVEQSKQLLDELVRQRMLDGEKHKKEDEANRTLCAFGKSLRYWCEMNGFPWKTMEMEEE